MKREVCPLVSVVVITYNSSETVLETLESIKKQTYQNIELIVSDDCSTDNTQSVVRHWLDNKENTLPFKRVIFTITPKNGGPAVNCNHGIRSSNGKWFKLIAADDLLLPNCIMQSVKYINKHIDTQILISKVTCFRGCEEVVLSQNDVNLYFWKLTRKQQYYMMLLDNWITAPSQFIRKDVWERLNGFDESIPFMEDYPFWIKAFQRGINFDFLDEPTVRYRLHDSLSRSKTPSNGIVNSRRLLVKYRQKCQYEVSPLFGFYGFVRENVKNKVIKKILFILNPFYWYVKYVHSLMKK